MLVVNAEGTESRYQTQGNAMQCIPALTEIYEAGPDSQNGL